jgi:peptidyl-prolyl cis-trans isomerase D
MLQGLREKTKSFVSYTLLFLLVASFAIWGIGDIFRQGNVKDWVIKVGNVKLPPSLLKRQFENENASLRNILGPAFSKDKARQMDLVKRSIDQLALITSLNLETNRLGLIISDDRIVRMLSETPQLHNQDGSFNRTMFELFLRQQGINESGFIDLQKRIAARNALVRGMALGVYVPEMAINDLASAFAQKRVAELIRINAEQLQAATALSDEDVKKYYEENKDSYKAPETRNFSVLVLKPEADTKMVVSEEDLKAAYEKQRDTLGQPETRTILQVVVDTEEKAKELSGASSASALRELAKEKGAEAVSLPNMKKKDLPEGLAEAAFERGTNQGGAPVKSALGWHVFLVEKITPGNTPTFEQAKAHLTDDLRKHKASDALVQTANKIDDMLASGKDIETVASSLSLEVDKYENRENNAADDKKLTPEILKTAFDTAEGDSSALVESKEGGYYLAQVTKVNPPHVQAFEDVQAKVKQDALTAARAKAATTRAQDIADNLRKGKDFASISGPGINKTTAPAVTADSIKQKDVPREALAPLFGMRKGEVAVVSTPEGELVVRVKDILLGDEADIAKRREALQKKLGADWADNHVDELANALRHVYPVKVDEKEVERLFGDDNG